MQLIIEFYRGPRDGQILVGDPQSEILDEATALYRRLTDNVAEDTVWTCTDYAVNILSRLKGSSVESAIAVGCRFPGHVYQLIDSRSDAAETRLCLLHVGPSE